MKPSVPVAGQRLCIVIPFFNHEHSIAAVVASLESLQLPCYLINDGSHSRCNAVLAALAQQHADWLCVIDCPVNQGKGGAVMTGIDAAARDGFTHALQIDADGQHRVEDARRLLSVWPQYPDAMITGCPIYDDSVPRGRLYGRYATHVWVWINTLSFQIRDSMCGLRIYPLQPTLNAWRNTALGRRMSFDIEILVRLCWAGLRIVNVPVQVSYPLDGVSHFKALRDNVQISWAHTRMFFGMLLRLPVLLFRRRKPILLGEAS